ncbi:MAG: hypothetical protein HZB12_03105, partial [Candidatus Yonathbacteria bacterium]|nr:hypothetical protein [Candidatus Yonathbacteria bacterium]
LSTIIQKFRLLLHKNTSKYLDIPQYFYFGSLKIFEFFVEELFGDGIKKFCKAYNSDTVLLGWGNKKERFIFKLVWSIFSLPDVFVKYPSIQFIVGVAYAKKDKDWLARQSGLSGVTVDMPLR